MENILEHIRAHNQTHIIYLLLSTTSSRRKYILLYGFAKSIEMITTEKPFDYIKLGNICLDC